MNMDEYFEALEHCIDTRDRRRGLKVLHALRARVKSQIPEEVVRIKEVIRVVEPLKYNQPVPKKKAPWRKPIPCWGTIKRDIRRRDEDKCRICAKDYYLHVHHIDHDHTNNKESNLVTLCESCHVSVHAENYKPSDHEDLPAPWDKTDMSKVNIYNQTQSW